jgi:cytochrome c553
MKPRANKIYCSRGCKEVARKRRKESPYSIHKKLICELCRFIPEHRCQLDVDHIDGNHQNNQQNNLMTLCANCHRLKTMKNKENNPYKHRNLNTGNG